MLCNWPETYHISLVCLIFFLNCFSPQTFLMVVDAAVMLCSYCCHVWGGMLVITPSVIVVLYCFCCLHYCHHYCHHYHLSICHDLCFNDYLCFLQLPPGGIFSHQCSVIFLQPGYYSVRVTCHAHGQQSNNANPTSEDHLQTHQSPTLSVTVTDPSVMPQQAER